MRKMNIFKSMLGAFLLLGSPAMYAQEVHLEWVKTIGGTSTDISHSMAVDRSGNVFTIGYFRETADFNVGGTANNLSVKDESDVFVTKHDASGNLVWAKRYGDVRNDEGNSIATDPAGNVYIAGRFVTEMDFGKIVLKSEGETDIFIAKLDTDGNCIWAKNIGNEGDQTATGLALDSSGRNLYIVGDLAKGQVDMNPGGTPAILDGQCMFILKLKDNGDFLWAKRIPNENGYVTLEEALDAITVSQDGYVHITGQFSGTVDFDPDGGNQTLTSTAGSNSFEDAFVLKLDSMGKYVWAKSLSGTGRVYSTAVSVDSKGNVYTTGSFDGTADFDPSAAGTANFSTAGIYSFDIFISKLDGQGNYVWAKAIGGTGTDRGFGVTVDKFDDVYATGGYLGKVDFNPATGVADTFFLNSNNMGNAEGYAFKLLANGDFAWAKTIAGGVTGSAGSNQGFKILTDPKGAVYTTGVFQGKVDLDPGADSFVLQHKGGNSDVFIHKMSCAEERTTLTVIRCEPFEYEEETYTETGIYTHTFASALGCDSIVTLELTINEITEPIITVDVFELSTVAVYDQYQWFLNGMIIPGATQRSYSVVENGSYTVVVETKEGCKDTSAAYGVTNWGETGISGAGGKTGSVHVYPNPVTDKIYVAASVDVDMQLTGIDGKVLKRTTDVRTLSVRDIAAGIYLLSIKDKKGSLLKVEKIIIATHN